jgi:hypothetical protein
MVDEKQAKVMESLARANEVRVQRAVLRANVGNGYARVSEILAAPDARTRGVTVAALLRWMPGVGTWRVQRFLSSAAVAPTRKVGDLTERERFALTAVVLIHENRRAA